MANNKEKTYLKTGRLKVGLAQTDVAYLLGIAPARVSQLERGQRCPHLDELLALEVIYETTGEALLKEHTQRVYTSLKRRSRSHQQRLLKDKKSANASKRANSVNRIINLLS